MAEIRCDICGLKDGHQGMTMIHCDRCKLAVHKECNGMNSYALEKFTCWACKAVGQSFEIEDRDEYGCRRRILQKDRPTKCALCNYSEGTHAMHPLYDRAGPGGRQIYTDGGLAWAHTLCAFVLTRRSFIFGCNRYGSWHGQDGDVDFNDDRSDNSELIDYTQESPEEYPNNTAPIHHFVYDLLNSSKQFQRIHYEKKTLRCSVCAVDDTPENVLRICVQCDANGENEFEEFREKRHMLSNEICYEALHVGCARWGGMNPNGIQRVYFFPGNEDRDTVVNIFCSLHAKDVDLNYQKEQKLLLEERRQMAQQQENAERPRSDREHIRDVLENQRQVAQIIANKKQTPQNRNGAPKRANSMNGVALKPAAKRTCSKRKEHERAIADDSSDEEEFEWEPSDDDDDDEAERIEGETNKIYRKNKMKDSNVAKSKLGESAQQNLEPCYKIGDRVRKPFYGKPYEGTIIEIWTKPPDPQKWYHVFYHEDNDEEDMRASEIKAYIIEEKDSAAATKNNITKRDAEKEERLMDGEKKHQV